MRSPEIYFDINSPRFICRVRNREKENFSRYCDKQPPQNSSKATKQHHEIGGICKTLIIKEVNREDKLLNTPTLIQDYMKEKLKGSKVGKSVTTKYLVKHHQVLLGWDSRQQSLYSEVLDIFGRPLVLLLLSCPPHEKYSLNTINQEVRIGSLFSMTAYRVIQTLTPIDLSARTVQLCRESDKGRVSCSEADDHFLTTSCICWIYCSCNAW